MSARNRYTIEARGEIAVRYAAAEFGAGSAAYFSVLATGRARAVPGSFRTREEALCRGLARVLELGSTAPPTALHFGSVWLINLRSGREEFLR